MAVMIWHYSFYMLMSTALNHYKVCSKSSWNENAKQQCIGHIMCSLSDFTTWPLGTQDILFQADWQFCLVFITGFVTECVVGLSCSVWSQ
jgi:hypothetical protein